MEGILVRCIEFSLSNYLCENATFYAEQLVARSCLAVGSAVQERALYYLGLCYLQENKPNRAYEVLKCAESGENRYLFAVSALRLGRLREAEQALFPGGVPLTDEEFSSVPNGACGVYILAVVAHRQGNISRAVTLYSKVLEWNPCIFSAYEALSILGKDIKPQVFFGTGEVDSSTCDKNGEFGGVELDFLKAEPRIPFEGHEGNTVLEKFEFRVNDGDEKGEFENAGRGRWRENDGNATGGAKLYDTPTIAKRLVFGNESPTCSGGSEANERGKFNLSYDDYRSSLGRECGDGGAKAIQHDGGNGGVKKKNTLVGTSPSDSYSIQKSLFDRADGVDSDGSAFLTPVGTKRLEFWNWNFISSANFKSNGCKGMNGLGGDLFDRGLDHSGDGVREVGGGCGLAVENGALKENQCDNDGGDNGGDNGVVEGMVMVLNLLREFGRVANSVQFYRCEEAISVIGSMCEEQRRSSWVMINLCRAYFELADYKNAMEVYRHLRNAVSYEMKGLEYYSTILWHNEMMSELSFLAHELITFESSSSEAWCVLGNCFSLKRDHKSALKCFQRAIQLNPRFVYGYTLSAHEYLAQDQWSKAMEAFRQAIYLDARHYNAWYGLGIIYLRQGKLDHAAYHFQRALKINDHNPVLYCNAGIVQYTSGNLNKALWLLQKALKLSPDHIPTQYHLSHVLLALNRADEAQELMEKMRDRAFKSGALALLSGRILKYKGEKTKALQEFILAQELEPKLSKYIKIELEEMDMGGRPIDLYEPPEIV